MNYTLKISLLSICLTGLSYAESAHSGTSLKTETVSSSMDVKIATDSSKDERRQKRKLERAKTLLEANLVEMKELETKISHASEDLKDRANLALAHAKLELEAAQNPKFADDIFFHARQGKRYIQRAKYVLEGKIAKFKEDRKKAKEEIQNAKATEKTAPTL